MELIYCKLTDDGLAQEGVLTEFQLDYDTAGEKNYELTVSTATANKGFDFWFVPNKEYGGIVERKKIDSEAGEVTLSGRNTRGLLNSRVLYDSTLSTLDFGGGFSDCFQNYIDEYFSTLFTIDESDVEFPNQVVPVGTTLYDAMTMICDSYDLHLSLAFDNYGKAHISLTTPHDFSDEMTYTNAGTSNFTLTTGYTECTTLIAYCDLAEKRHTITIYTDDQGGIQPYTKTDIPVQDSDYLIDDDSYKVVTGYEEKVMAMQFDCQPKYNYRLLLDTPADWVQHYDKYYNYSADDDEYSEVEGVETQKYTLLTAQPDDWSTAYDSYYTKNASSKYTPAKGTSKATYKLLTSKPKDWAVNYGNYYRRKTDGTVYSYYAVSASTSTVYKKQTVRPSKWETSFNTYFQAVKSGSKWTYTQVSGIGKDKVAPTWVKGKYYTKQTVKSTPKFKLGEIYYLSKTLDIAPTFVTKTYYSLDTVVKAPLWDDNTYYQRYTDNYASLVSQAVEALSNYNTVQSISFTLYNSDVDVGDIVGCTDLETNTTAIGKVTNIIYKVSGASEEYQYEVGD